MRPLTRFPLHPLLLAVYAVLFLYAENLEEVLLVDAAAPLTRSVVVAAVLLAALGLAFRDARRGALVASALIVAFFGYGHVAELAAGLRIDERVQLAAWGLVVLVAIVGAARARGSLPRLTNGLNGVALVLVGLTLVTIVPFELERGARRSVVPAGAVDTGVGATDGGTTRDIWYLVFDRYGSAESIERRFGLTGNDLPGWLVERGFQVPADSRASYRATDFSLASTLNLRHLDELTETVGPASSDRTPARELLREHEVGRFLKERGYRYYHVGSWFGPTASNPIADETLTLGAASEFETVLHDTTILPALDRVRGIEEAELDHRGRHAQGALFQFRQLHRLTSAPGPKFVFAHVLLPHDPYVFRADGSIIGEDEARSTEEDVLFAGHLAFVNARIRELVAELLAGPDATDPIVVIQGDEGPIACRNTDCPTDTPDYYGIRFPILNALFLPGVEEPLPATFTSVNTFRTVFREYFGADLPPLPDRSYTWPDNDHLYDFRDITDRIPP
jgi:hypothetical protein